MNDGVRGRDEKDFPSEAANRGSEMTSGDINPHLSSRSLCSQLRAST